MAPILATAASALSNDDGSTPSPTSTSDTTYLGALIAVLIVLLVFCVIALGIAIACLTTQSRLSLRKSKPKSSDGKPSSSLINTSMTQVDIDVSAASPSFGRDQQSPKSLK